MIQDPKFRTVFINLFFPLIFNFIGPFSAASFLASIDRPTLHMDLKNKSLDKMQLQQLYQEIQSNPLIGHITWGILPEGSKRLKEKIEEKIIQNNKLYRHHPSDFIHALLSAHVYKDSKEGEKVKFRDYESSYAYNDYLKYWRIHKVHAYPEAGGYYSIVYINDQTRQIVLAHRGTTLRLRDLFNKDSPLKTDIKGILGKEIVAQQAVAFKVVKHIVNEAKEKGYNLSVTGHSLGAWLAELSLYFAYRDFNCTSVKAVTFDSPGSVVHMDNLQGNIVNQLTEFRLKDLNIVTYLSAPNFVNSCNKHVGRVYRVFPAVSLPKTLQRTKSWSRRIKQKLNWDKDNTLDCILSIFGHSLDPLVATFDPKTGKPKVSHEVLDWPTIKYTSRGKKGINLLTDWMEAIFTLVTSKELINLQNSIEGSAIMTLVAVLEEVMTGRLDQKQYFSYFGYINDNPDREEKEYSIREGLSETEEFSLTYEGHYRAKKVNLLEDVLASDNRGSADWYLKELKKKDVEQIEEEITRKQLNLIKEQYEIIPQNKTIINAKSVEIDQLREWILRLTSVNPGIKKLLEDPTACLGKSEIAPPTILTSYLPQDRVSNFIEQDNVFNTLEEILSSDQYAVISGLPGSGKSSNALEYTYRQRNKIGSTQTIVRWFAADSSHKIELEYRSLAVELGIKKLKQEKQLIINLVNSQLSRMKEQILFIFDNVEEYAHIKEYLINLPSHAKVLITTRNTELTDTIKQIRITPFNTREIKKYIKISLKEDLSDQQQEELFKALGPSNREARPIKLAQTIAYFKENNLSSPEKCIQDIKNQQIEQPLTTLLLKLLKKSPLAWDILEYASCLDSDFISIDIFKELFEVDETILKEPIKKLTSLSLVAVVGKKGKGITLHRLVQQEIIEYIQRTQDRKSVIKKEHLNNKLLKVINTLLPKVGRVPGKDWDTADGLYAHAIKVVTTESTTNLAEKAALYSKLARYNEYVLRKFKQSLEYDKSSLRMKQALYQNNHPDIAQSFHDIGWGYLRLGDAQKALEYQKQALKIRQKLYQDTHQDVARTFSALGEIYITLGKLQEAINVQEQALKIRQKLYQGNHPKVINSLNTLGRYYHILDKPKIAVDYHTQALTRAQELYQGDHPIIAQILNNMGRDYFALGEIRQALEYQLKALKIYQDIYKGNHPETADALSEVGLSYDDLGDMEKALKCYKDALKMQQSLYESNHPSVATSLHNVGWAYRNLGQVEKGLQYQVQALKMRQELYHGNHPDIANSLDTVGTAYKTLGNPQKALKYQKQALKMRQELYKDNHPDIAKSLNNIGCVYRNLGQVEKGLQYQVQALKMRQELYYGNHPEIARTLNDIGASYQVIGNAKRALEFHQKALKMRQELYKDNHPDIAYSLDNIGETYQALGYPRKALEFHQKALEIHYPLAHEHNPDIAKVLANIGFTYQALGEIDKAISFLKQASDLNLASLGAKHPITQKLKNDIIKLEKIATFQIEIQRGIFFP